MCGRYGRRGDKQKIAERFQVKGDLEHLALQAADYNIAPTTDQPIIWQSRETGERELVLARWGWYRSSARASPTSSVYPPSTRGPINREIPDLARADEEAPLPGPGKLDL